ncbi:murein hydrolase activator EnvC family protein [Psychromonas antarctica]|uniref:murein hydrolase activator EnvC family protein n=1 Tax=Psychromonas antarctica TaxID=67573 RepID=UPI001EE8F413|nr:peptidoglycan DD-metalloendopeptidase family protein [Psychromonas antarctica]MCG6202172.1 peptidoglycan DD-metalloendopeptidase family protein [Psychromonas antarctica]
MKSINLYKNSSLKTILLNSLLSLSLLALTLQSSVAGNDLSALQQKIKKSQGSQAKMTKKQATLEEQIASSEQETSAAIFQAQQTEDELIAERKRLKKLKEQTVSLEKNKIKQQKLLQQQLISAYMTGQNDLIKLLLNQEDLSKIIRAKSYYFYINKARLESIERLQATQIQLDKNKKEQADSLVSLEAMHQKQKAAEKTLVEQRAQRTKALQELKQDLNYQNARLAQLSNAEARLKKVLTKAAEVRQEQELAAAKENARKKIVTKDESQSHSRIASRQGALKWPILGDVLSTFGSQRSSQVKWKGIAIAANEGEKVRAVATGRVLFAGYFKGYGMVIALDHSDNYITLYGYNQTLLQKTGDTVFEGDAIALAGHSGGQDKNSLYFELSYKGKAQDPMRWLKKRDR